MNLAFLSFFWEKEMMKPVVFTSFLIFVSMHVYGQNDSTAEYPFGQINPDAPHELADYDPLIGSNECTSELRNPDGEWNSPISMTWNWKYIMNGWGVQDETFSESGIYAGSIRQFNPDSSAWYVHYYSSRGTPSTLPSWKGGKNDDDEIILYREQKAPNGMDGFFKISFTDIKESSFQWLGEWVNPDESIKYPTWKISCTKAHR